MYNINATKKLGELELEHGLEGNRSWHHKYRNSAYIYVGGLHQGLTEGDVVIVFSQFGEIVDVNLKRDKSTGKSMGFAFLCYEDQKSTIIAVDNMNGYQLMNRAIRVDHVDKYKAPKILDENQLDENGDPVMLEYKATGAEGAGIDSFNVINSQKKMDEINSKRKKTSARIGGRDEDEAWANAFEDGLKRLKEQGAATAAREGGKKKDKKKLKKDMKEIKKMEKEAKRLQAEAKVAKEEAKNQKRDKTKRSKKEPTESSDDSEDDSDSSSSEKPRKKASNLFKK